MIRCCVIVCWKHTPQNTPPELIKEPTLPTVLLIPYNSLLRCATPPAKPLLTSFTISSALHMDISTPRRNPARNSHAAQEPPYLSGSPKHLTDFSSHAPPPPLPLHARATNESWDPQPSVEWNTPQSSPTKNTAHLVELFDKSLQLAPSSSPTTPQPTPTKRALRTRNEDHNANASVLKLDDGGKVTRRNNNKENAASFAPDREHRKSTGAAMSRGYGQSGRKKYDPMNDLTLEDLEKLAKPSVKRLKDVAHLCRL